MNGLITTRQGALKEKIKSINKWIYKMVERHILETDRAVCYYVEKRNVCDIFLDMLAGNVLYLYSCI